MSGDIVSVSNRYNKLNKRFKPLWLSCRKCHFYTLHNFMESFRKQWIHFKIIRFEVLRNLKVPGKMFQTYSPIIYRCMTPHGTDRAKFWAHMSSNRRRGNDDHRAVEINDYRQPTWIRRGSGNAKNAAFRLSRSDLLGISRVSFYGASKIFKIFFTPHARLEINVLSVFVFRVDQNTQ